MPYILYNSNGTQLATIADGSINATSTPLTFVGKNYAGYGSILNQNLVYLLQNFANPTSPTNPVIGQLWYDSANKILKTYNGSIFKPLSSFNAGILPPTNNTTGDFWFDQNANQLYFYNGVSFILIGPQQTGDSVANALPSQALGTDKNKHNILNFKVTDDSGISRIVGVASRDEFTPSPNTELYDANFTIIKQGITLPTSDANNGNSISNANEGAYYFWGTAATAAALVYPTNAGSPAVVHPATDFFLYSDWKNALNDGLHINNNYGIIVGPRDDFKFQYSGAPNFYGQIVNMTGAGIDFQINLNGQTSTVISIQSESLIPSQTLAFDLGSPSNTYNNLYVNTATINVIKYNTITGSDIISTDLVRGTNGLFDSFTATTFNSTNALITNLSSGVTTLGPGLTTVTGDGVVDGNLTVYQQLTQQGNLVVENGASITANNINLNSGYNLVGNTVGNLNGTNNIVTATTIYTTNLLAIGGSFNSVGNITGAWTLNANSSISLGTNATIQATYSDLAERYHADADYGYGTVLIVGGINEVTTTDIRANTSVAGVISQAPAYMMNKAAGPDSTHPYIALKGRIPCKVVGIIHKGDRLVTSTRHGYAEAFQLGDDPTAVIGIALEDNIGDSGMIEIKV
jgi:hypothetical protein